MQQEETHKECKETEKDGLQSDCNMGAQFTVISLFAGCGGSSLGYKWAGFKELLAVDYDRHSCECFSANFPGVPMWNMDMAKVSGKKIMDDCGIKAGELDVLDASPPCQGFSMAGRRNVNDGRNMLFMEFIRILGELRPKMFLMENVPGMATGRMRGIFNEAMQILKESGYWTKAAIMDASYYGVPQMRQRIIFIGTRKDLNLEPTFPRPMKRTNIMDIQELNDILAINPGQYSKIWKSRKNPSPTLTKSRSLYCLGSDNQKRQITINEAKAICSFPQDFILPGSDTKQWARLGNAVMPKFMFHIATHLREMLLKVTN